MTMMISPIHVLKYFAFKLIIKKRLNTYFGYHQSLSYSLAKMLHTWITFIPGSICRVREWLGIRRRRLSSDCVRSDRHPGEYNVHSDGDEHRPLSPCLAPTLLWFS